MNTIKSRQNNPVSRKTKFLNLMDIYERNYIHLRNLIPELKRLSGEFVSYVPGCIDLHLSVVEQCRYTTIINLTYQFEHGCSNGGAVFHRNRSEPNLEIRIYHDAQVAECREGSFYDYVQDSASVSENKWYLNRFLYKWLVYCIEKGHAFNVNDKRNEYQHSIAQYLLTGFSKKNICPIKQ